MKLRLILTAGLALFAAQAARADFTAHLDSVDWSKGQGYDAGSSSTSSPAIYFAGSINWTQSTADMSWAVGGTSTTFSSFCIELHTNVYIGSDQTYKLAALADSPVGESWAPLHATKAAQIEILWAEYRGKLDTAGSIASGATVNQQYAAFQAAIWEIEYAGTTSPYSAYSPANSTIHGLAATMYNFATAAGNLNTAARANLVALTSTTTQDQIVEIKSGYYYNGDGGVVPTPVPPALILGFTGLVPFAPAFRRVRGAKQPVA